MTTETPLHYADAGDLIACGDLQDEAADDLVWCAGVLLEQGHADAADAVREMNARIGHMRAVFLGLERSATARLDPLRGVIRALEQFDSDDASPDDVTREVERWRAGDVDEQ